MFKLLLTASVVSCDLYLFHIISLLNPDFKLVNNLISSSLDKVTAGTFTIVYSECCTCWSIISITSSNVSLL